MSEVTNFGRVKSAAYENQNGQTVLIVTMPGKHHLQPGELVGIITKESTK